MTKETDSVQNEKIKELKDRNYQVEQRTKWLEEHYSTFNSEMGTVKTDVAWLKKLMILQITLTLSGFGGLIALIFYLR